jgi:hypothetical protein
MVPPHDATTSVAVGPSKYHDHSTALVPMNWFAHHLDATAVVTEFLEADTIAALLNAAFLFPSNVLSRLVGRDCLEIPRQPVLLEKLRALDMVNIDPGREEIVAEILAAHWGRLQPRSPRSITVIQLLPRCQRAVSCKLPGLWILSNLSNLSGMVASCESPVTSIDLDVCLVSTAEQLQLQSATLRKLRLAVRGLPSRLAFSLDDCPNITKLELNVPGVTAVGDRFLREHPSLREVSLDFPDVVEVGDNFRFGCRSLTAVSLSLPSLTTVKVDFLGFCNGLGIGDFHLPLPALSRVASGFLASGVFRSLELDLPALTEVGAGFLEGCSIEANVTITLPLLRTAGSSFLVSCKLPTLRLSLPSVTAVGQGFLASLRDVHCLSFELPAATDVSYWFLGGCKQLTSLELSLPSVTKIHKDFLRDCPQLCTVALNLPKATSLGAGWLADCPNLSKLNVQMPRVTAVGDGFLRNTSLTIDSATMGSTFWLEGSVFK